MHSEVWSNCSYGTDCLAGSHGIVSSQTISHFLIPLTAPGLPAHLILQYQPTASGAISRAYTFCQVGGLKQQIPEHSQGISTEMLQHVVTPTKCHIQTVKINMNSHQHETPLC